MQIKFIEKGTALFVYEKADDQNLDAICETKFFDIKDETTFYAEGMEFHSRFSKLREYDRLKIIFLRGPNMYEFFGKVTGVAKSGGAYLTLIEQLTGMVATSRRRYSREELEIDVRLYGISQDDLQSGNLKKADNDIEFNGVTLDIGSGGLCVVSNNRLDSAYEPFFLVEFTLNRKDEFLLPAKLVRKGSCPQTVLYRYDYGFEFLYDYISREGEEQRLTTALFSAKLALFNR